MATTSQLAELGSTSNVTGPFTTPSFAPAVGDQIVVFFVATATLDNTATCTESAGGGTYTLQHTLAWSGTSSRLYVFTRDTKTENTTSRTVTCNVPADATTGSIVVVGAVQGLAKQGTASVRQVNSAKNGAATTPAVTMGSAILTSNPLLALIVNGFANTGAGFSASQPSGFSLIGDIGFSTPTTGSDLSEDESGNTSTTVTWGASSATAWGAAVVEFNAANDGTGTPTLGTLTLSAAGTVASSGVSGTGTPTLGALTLSAAGTVAIQGSGSPSLGTLTLSAAGTVPRTGSGSPTLGTLTLSAAGTVAVQGTGTPTLGVLTLSSAGTVVSPGINGTGTPTLGVLTLSAAGQVPRTGSGSPTLGTLTLAAAGQVPRTGSGSPTLGVLTLAAAGTVVGNITGTGSPTLGVFVASAAGVVPITGTGSPTLGVLVLGAAGGQPFDPEAPIIKTGRRLGDFLFDPTFDY